MRILFFDTETSGFPEQGGRLIQFAATICDYSFESPLTVKEFSTLVKCNVEIDPGAFRVHGISQEMTQAGVECESVLKWFKNEVAQSDLIVCHNTPFDVKVMDGEMRHLDGGGFSPENTFCTMRNTTNICKIPKARGNGYKWPKLVEALEILCDHQLEGAHDALVDTRGCKMIFDYLVENGIYKIPSRVPINRDDLI